MPILAFILGREQHLSVAEISAVIGDGAEWAKAELSGESLVLQVDSQQSTVNSTALMARLGGTVKIGEVWRTIELKNGERKNGEQTEHNPDGIDEAIGRYILDQTTADRKVHFGYSVYDLGGGSLRVREVRESLRRGAAAQKAWLEERGRKVRWVTSREPTLSSVIVAKNDLLPDRNGVEVLVLVGADRIVLARTLAVQPFEEWGRRDYGRPSRDARSGMLPPKLARAMMNIALARSSKLKAQSSNFALLDPFCGSGTILTEAMALGVPKIIGTDVSAEAVADAKANVAWMHHQYSLSERSESKGPSTSSGTTPSVIVRTCDVRQLSQCVRERVDVIVTEPYLGPPKLQADSRKLQAELRLLYVDAFREFARVLKPGGRAVFIVPVFREREVVLDITRDVAAFGFHRIEPFPAPLRDHLLLRGKADLPYARPHQRVGRKILVFEKGRQPGERT